MPAEQSTRLRLLMNERLALLSDPRFEGKIRADAAQIDEVWNGTINNLIVLQTKKRGFFDTYNYDWAFDAGAYNSAFEAQLQWRLLNVISDISSDHPSLSRCKHMVVRLVPTSRARTHIRNVDEYRVIVLTNGYLSVFKGFIRLWLRGCALGRRESKRPPKTYKESMQDYIVGVRNNESIMTSSAMAYVGTLLQLNNNDLPFMDRESIFDEEVLKKKDFLMEFGMLCNAIDGFVIFHEVAHVLEGDDHCTDRTMEVEIRADRGSTSLCIIDEARRGGHGTVHLGAPMFFCVELLRLLSEEIIAIGQKTHDPSNGRYPGIDELMLRSQLYSMHVQKFLGPRLYSLLAEWENAMRLVFDTVRWALLNAVRATDLPLQDFAFRSIPSIKK